MSSLNFYYLRGYFFSFTFYARARADDGIHIVQNQGYPSRYITIMNNKCNSNGKRGIWFSEPRYVQCLYNEVRYNTGDGIHIDVALPPIKHSVLLIGNHITNNQGRGLYCNNTLGTVVNHLKIDNHIHQNVGGDDNCI